MIAGMVFSNLLYVVGAIVVATVVSGFVLFRHRRPRSLESSIEMFSRELKALEPERPGGRPVVPGVGGRVPGAGGMRDGGLTPRPVGSPSAGAGQAASPGLASASRSGTVARVTTPEGPENSAQPITDPRPEAARSPEQEPDPG